MEEKAYVVWYGMGWGGMYLFDNGQLERSLAIYL